MTMSGVYWSLGVGYREQQGTWIVEPEENDKQIDFGLVDEDTGKLHHEVKISGMTGHGRLGYRYIGNQYPFVAGLYAGARHWQSSVEDNSEDAVSNEEQLTENEYTVAMTEKEKSRLKRRFMTRPELGVEFGWAF